MGLKGIASKEEEDEYGNPLVGAKTFDIQGDQAIEVSPKASLLKSAKKPVAGSGVITGKTAEDRKRGYTLASEDKDSPFFTPPSTLNPDLSEGELGKRMMQASNPPVDAGGLRRQDFASEKAYDAAVADQKDEDQPFGFGGALSQAPRQLGTKSGALRRAGRAAGRMGAAAQANQLFGAAAMQGINEPNIMTEEQRGRVASKQQEAIDLTRQNQAYNKKYMDYANKLLDRRLKGLNSGGGTGRAGMQYRGLGQNPYSNIQRGI
jgi:hypothetical protein